MPVTAKLRYVRSADHEHWHMLDFMRYELRRANGKLVAPDRKTGFCLGDRYEIQLQLGRAEPEPTYTEECGKGQRGLLRLREGISVGYGDDYDAHLEGQSFDVTGLAGRPLPAGAPRQRGRVLRETDYSNNASSMSFELGWPNGKKSPPSSHGDPPLRRHGDLLARAQGPAVGRRRDPHACRSSRSRDPRRRVAAPRGGSADEPARRRSANRLAGRELHDERRTCPSGTGRRRSSPARAGPDADRPPRALLTVSVLVSTTVPSGRSRKVQPSPT